MTGFAARCSLLIVAALALSSCTKTVPKINHAQDTLLRGYLVVNVGNSKDQHQSGAQPPGTDFDVAIPGVEVYLEDPSTTGKSKPVTTDLSGRFTLNAPGKGDYRLCWASKIYGMGCENTTWSVGTEPLFVSAVHMAVPPRGKMAGIYGRVTDLDGLPVRSYDPYFNINSFAQVQIRDTANHVLSSVYVNNFGEYVVPYLPVTAQLVAVVDVELGRVQQDLLPDAKLGPGTFSNVNLTVKNHAPKLSPLAAGDGAGNRIQNASPGGEVIVNAPARDDDGDKLGWRWFLGQGAGTLSSNTGPTVKWKLPAAPGHYSIAVVAYDRKGGYDRAALALLADGKGAPFSGRVVTIFGAPIGGAKVQIVGNLPVTADAHGYFATRVKLANRYVFNARADNYALNSQIYDHGVTGGVWMLHPAQSVSFNPATGVTVTHKRERDCPGPASWVARHGVAGNSILVPQWQDGKGHVIDAPKDPKGGGAFIPGRLQLRPCGPGVSVSIPAGAIVDSSGNPVTTPITAQISTVDLASPQQMPGDDGVLKSGGGGAALESFGAGSFDLPAGMKLRPGATATVTIPVDRLPLSGGVPTPPTIPLLSYDEQQGVWLEEGTLTLTNVSGVMSYVGQVKHFSPFNADNVKDDSSACIRVFSSPFLPPKYFMDVAAPYHGTGAPKLVTHEIDQTDGNENVIYNLPQNVNVTITAYTEGSPSNLLGVYVVNSLDKAVPNTSPNAPNYVTDAAHPGDIKFNGYIACNNFIVLKTGSAPDSPLGGEFLHGLGVLDAENLGFTDLTNAAPTGNALIDAVVAASKSYYDQVDPTHIRRTFHDFKDTNHFQQLANDGLANGEYVAQYANSGDLGFGRDMHCRETDTSNHYYACYVTNYGTGYSNAPFGAGTDDQDDANAAGHRNTVGGSKEIATVAMEYSPIENNPAGVAVVKFFVYFNDGVTYPLVIDANLDGRGQRPVPQLCMVCHGGFAPHQGTLAPIFGSADDVKLNARFLPFDYRAYTFSNDNAALTAASQDAQFKHLNQDVVDHVPAGEPTTDPIREVVHALYNDSGHVDSPNELLDSPVPGWLNGASANVSNQATFYNHNFAWGCRGCHIAQPFTQIQFKDSQGLITLSGFPPGGNSLMLGTVENRVCGDYLMPHALRTHEIFWGTYNQYLPNVAVLDMPNELNTFGGNVTGAVAAGNWKPNLCTTFLSPTATSPSVFYTQVIQPIFNGKCVGCHIGGSAPFGIDLTESHSFTILHSGTASVPHLIEPGSDDPANAHNVMLSQVATNQMPQNCNASPSPPASYYTCLTPTDITNIKAWLKNGAN